jgi:hypothetical protein
MEKQNQNAENLLFQLQQLQKEGKSVGSLKKRTEETIFEDSEKKLTPQRLRWELIDEDIGVAFYRKGSKHMDFVEGEDEYRGIKYKDIIIYDANLIKDVMVRSKKEPLKSPIEEIPEEIIFRDPEQPLESQITPRPTFPEVKAFSEKVYKEGEPCEVEEIPDIEVYKERSKFSANDSKSWLEKRDEREKKRSEGQSKETSQNEV